MGPIQSFLFGAVGATTVWFITEFLGRPFRAFFDLRREVARRLAQYANVRARFKMNNRGDVEATDISSDEERRLKEAEDLFRDLASQVRAFATAEYFAVKMVRLFRFDAMKAAGALIGFSNNIGTYGQARHDSENQVRNALRIYPD